MNKKTELTFFYSVVTNSNPRQAEDHETQAENVSVVPETLVAPEAQDSTAEAEKMAALMAEYEPYLAGLRELALEIEEEIREQYPPLLNGEEMTEALEDIWRYGPNAK